MDFIKKHKRKIAISAVALVGVAAGVWYFFVRKPSEEEEEVIADQVKLTKSQILLEAKVERAPNGRLTIASIKSLYHALVDWSQEDYAKIVINYRKARRAASTPEAYIKEYNQFNDSLEKVLAEAQTELLSKLGLDEKVFDADVEAYMNEGNRDLHFIHMHLPQQMNASIPCRKSHVGINFKDIVRGQLTYLQENSKSLLAYAPAAGEHFPGIIQSKLNDYVYEKFGLEEEDIGAIVKNGPEILRDPAMLKLMMGLQQETGKTIQTGLSGSPGHPAGPHSHQHVHGESCNHEH